MLPKHVYYRYTTARLSYYGLNHRKNPVVLRPHFVLLAGIFRDLKLAVARFGRVRSPACGRQVAIRSADLITLRFSIPAYKRNYSLGLEDKIYPLSSFCPLGRNRTCIASFGGLCSIH